MKILTIPVILAVLVACVEDVGKDKVKATVQDAPAEAPAQAEAPPPEATPAPESSHRVDASASTIQALGAKITATHPIDFPTFEGKVGMSDGKLTSVAYTVTMADLVSDAEKLTAHLKDADFFDVATYPTSSFQSTTINEGSDAEGATHTITGDMTIRGVTKRLTFPATVTVADGKVEASTEFVIDRRDFGVVYPGRPDDLVQDNVRMTIKLVAPLG